MKTLFSWFNDRTGFGDWCGRLADSPVPGGPCWCKVLPCTILFLFCVQAITGFFLWVYYSPSAETAWESVYFLQYEVAGGWLLRAIHHYAAHVLLAILIIYVVQSILTRACRAPRELVFWATVGLGLCALAAVLTGDLLSWDQNGYAATKTRTGFLTLLPWVGDKLLKIAIGGPGPALGHLTLTRFFALHVGVFAGGFLVLLIVRGVLAGRANQCTPHAPREEACVTRSVTSTIPLLARPGLARRRGLPGRAGGRLALGLPARRDAAAGRRAAALAGRHRSGQCLCRRAARVVFGGRVRVFAPLHRPLASPADLRLPGLLVLYCCWPCRFWQNTWSARCST